MYSRHDHHVAKFAARSMHGFVYCLVDLCEPVAAMLVNVPALAMAAIASPSDQTNHFEPT